MHHLLTASRFAHWLDNVPVPTAANNFHTLCRDLGILQHTLTSAVKTATPAFSPCTYRAGAPRGKAGVEQMTLFVADYDKIPEADFASLLDYLTAAGLEYAIYSTYSHGAPAATLTLTYSFRLLIPLSAPVPAQQWAYVWPALAGRLPCAPDSACRDTSRIYGLAYTPYPASAFTEYSPGKPWDVPTLPDTGNSKGVFALRAAAATGNLPLLQKGVWPAQDELRDWIKTLATYRNQSGMVKKAWLYDVARALRDGKPFANLAQGRHETLLHLTYEMERKWPHVETSAIAELFVPSLETMASVAHQADQGPLDVDQRLQEIQRLLDGAREKRLAALDTTAAPVDAPLALPAPDGRIQRLRKDDATPYTQQELRLICEQQGVPLPPDATDDQVADALRGRWLLHRGKSFYVLTLDAGYVGPSFESDFPSTPRRLLSRAVSAGVQLLTQAGKNKKPADLFNQYGAELEEVNLAYTAKRATASLTSRNVLTEQAAPIRADLRTKAAHFPEVAKWLELLAGNPDTHRRLLDWLACVPLLDEPVAALYLDAPSGAGKNLLVLSLARLFHRGGPVGLGTVLDGKWNGALVNCPIVVADEAMPSSATFENVCEFIGTTTRDMLRKYAPNATLQGATRLLLTANKDTMMSFEHQGRKTYTKEQFEAVAKRVLYVRANTAPAEYLSRTLPPGLTNRWVKSIADDPEQGEAISRHILHLAATRTVQRQPGARFLVEGNFELMLDKFVDTNPLIAKIIEWCARLLRNPHPLLNAIKRPDSQGATTPSLLRGPADFAGTAPPGACWYLLLSPGLLHAAWSTLLGESRRDAPDAAKLRPALEALQPPALAATGQVPAGQYAIPVRHILRQNAANGFDTQGAAQELLVKAGAMLAQPIGAIPLDAVAPPSARLAAVSVATPHTQNKVAPVKVS